MTTVRDVTSALNTFAPPPLAESWDNTGLLLGDPDRRISTLLTCLTLTPDVAAEAISAGAGLIVSHHPILFRPVKKLTSATSEGAMILDLVHARVAVYSPHTSFDGTAGGINQQIAQRLNLQEIRPLRPAAEAIGLSAEYGVGRIGRFSEPQPFESVVRQIKQLWNLPALQAVPFPGDVRTVAIGCGSAGEFLSDAERLGCELFITGEARFHTALEARTAGIGLVLLGHYASERFAVETLAQWLGEQFPDLTVTASTAEWDPIQLL